MASAKENSLEFPKIELCDVKKKSRKDFDGRRLSGRTRHLPNSGEECCICYVEDGYEMKCEHFICANCILGLAWTVIENNNYTICCGTCSAKIDIDDVIKYGVPNGTEKQFILTALSFNLINKEDIQQCPRCSSYCERIDSENQQVNCDYCRSELGKPYLFCWKCLKDWKSEQSASSCGNVNCGRMPVVVLKESSMITFTGNSGNDVEAPSVRACPNCYSLVEHIEGCNEMTCNNCKHIFCFICLCEQEGDALKCNTESWGGRIFCTPAPIQDKFKSVVRS